MSRVDGALEDLPEYADRVDGGGLDEVKFAAEVPLEQRMVQVLRTLRLREQTVLRLRFGLDESALTLEATGRRLEISGEQARRIETVALRKLRHPARACALSGFVTFVGTCV